MTESSFRLSVLNLNSLQGPSYGPLWNDNACILDADLLQRTFKKFHTEHFNCRVTQH